MIAVSLQDDVREGVERFIADRADPPLGKMTSEDAVNVIVRDWLMGQGYIPLPGDPGKVTPALEAAQVPKA